MQFTSKFGRFRRPNKEFHKWSH